MSKTTTAPPSPIVPAGRIMLGGRERILRFTLRSHMALEDVTGRPWYDVLAEAELGFSRALIRLVWACLQHEPHPPAVEDTADELQALGEDARTAAYRAADKIISESLPRRTEADSAGPLAPAA